MRSAWIATAAAIHLAVVVSVGIGRADGASRDGDEAAARILSPVLDNASNGMRIVYVRTCEGAHRRHRAAAIHLIIYTAAFDFDGGIAIHITGRIAILLHREKPRDKIVALAAAEHVATEDTTAYAELVFDKLTIGSCKMELDTIVSSSRNGIFVRCTRSMQRYTADDRTSLKSFLNENARAFLHVAVLAAAKHVAHHIGTSLDDDLGGVDEGKFLQLVTRNASASTKHHAFVGTEVLESGVNFR